MFINIVVTGEFKLIFKNYLKYDKKNVRSSNMNEF